MEEQHASHLLCSTRTRKERMAGNPTLFFFFCQADSFKINSQALQFFGRVLVFGRLTYYSKICTNPLPLEAMLILPERRARAWLIPSLNRHELASTCHRHLALNLWSLEDIFVHQELHNSSLISSTQHGKAAPKLLHGSLQACTQQRLQSPHLVPHWDKSC